MPDGRTTPDEEMITSALAGPSGKWVFTSLDDLDKVIRQWTDICDRLQEQRKRLARTVDVIRPPASDIMSVIQTEAFVRSLGALQDHAIEMHTYADKYVVTLTAARDKYASTERDITDRLKGTHG